MLVAPVVLGEASHATDGVLQQHLLFDLLVNDDDPPATEHTLRHALFRFESCSFSTPMRDSSCTAGTSQSYQVLLL